MSDDWKGGYKTPPVANRFKPGQSGNTKGRPPYRDQDDPLDVIIRVLTRPITVVVNNRRRQAPAIGVVAQRVAHLSAHGNSRAAKIWWELVDHVFAWEEQHDASGRIEVRYADWDGNVLSEPPPPTPRPPKK